MRYYPINLVLKDKKCVVIGAGRVAERKVWRLVECGARILVVGPSATLGLKAMADKGLVVLKRREAVLRDTRGAHLVIAATADSRTNSRFASYCRKNNILVNVVDSPEECSFIAPSVIQKGDLVISISTGGISPALSKRLRQNIEKTIGVEYAAFLRIMKKIRPRALRKIKGGRSRRHFFKRALSPEVLGLLKRHKAREASRKIEGILNDVS